MKLQKNKMLIALIDEYKRATKDLKAILTTLSTDDFLVIRDKNTTDPDCTSIQTVVSHCIHSGYTYASYIQQTNNGVWFTYKKEVDTPSFSMNELDKMLTYTEKSFLDNWQKTNEEIEKTFIKTRWNVTYNVEQLLEHAIVHILRHRRQIEKFLKIS